MRGRHRVHALQGLALLLGLAVAAAISAQQPLSIRGQVRFPDGSVPDLAFVTLIGPDVERRILPNDDGSYGFASLPDGTYTLRAFGSTSDQAGSAEAEGVEITAQTPLPVVVDLVLISP